MGTVQYVIFQMPSIFHPISYISLTAATPQPSIWDVSLKYLPENKNTCPNGNLIFLNLWPLEVKKQNVKIFVVGSTKIPTI